MKNVPKLRFKGFNDEWEEKALGEVVEFYDNMRKPVKEGERNQGIYPYYGATGIIDYINDYIFEGEYLLLGEDGANIVTRNAPLIYLTKGKFWVNNHAHIFKTRDKYSNYYFKQYLETINYVPYNTGTAQPKLNIENVKKIPIKTPSLEEQEKIAKFLTKVDNFIEKQEEKVNNLEQYKKGMMQKIFSQEIRFKKDDGGEYPDWEYKKLGDICDIIMGQSPNSEFYNEEFNGIPLIQGNADMKNRKTNPRMYTSVVTKTCEIGDIIMSVRAPAGTIAKSEHKACIGRGVCAIKVKEEKEFIYQLLLIQEDKWSRFSQGSTFDSINSSDIKEISFNIPCIDEQVKIAKFLSNIDSIVDKEKEKLEELRLWKKGLLQQMFV